MTKFSTINCGEFEIETMTTNEPDAVDKWIKQIYGRYGRKFGYSRKVIVGLDIEWQPYTKQQTPRTLQLCTGKKCIVIQLPLRGQYGVHETLLKGLLKNKRFVFAGVGIKSDIKKLENWYPHLCFHDDGYDLAGQVREKGLDCKGRYGLESLAKHIGELKFVKDTKVARSEWGASELSDEQIEYAARDAFVSFHVAKMLIWNY